MPIELEPYALDTHVPVIAVLAEQLQQEAEGRPRSPAGGRGISGQSSAKDRRGRKSRGDRWRWRYMRRIRLGPTFRSPEAARAGAQGPRSTAACWRRSELGNYVQEAGRLDLLAGVADVYTSSAPGSGERSETHRARFGLG